MALDPEKLQNSIVEILQNPPDSKVRASHLWSAAIVDFANPAFLRYC